jgi:hypothetical protein
MLIDKDMTFMRDVFVSSGRRKPSLPYDEFITEWGENLSLSSSNEGGHYFAKYVFPNGTRVSVVCGAIFLSRIDAPYEISINQGEAVGYQTAQDLMLLLSKAIGDVK